MYYLHIYVYICRTIFEYEPVIRLPLHLLLSSQGKGQRVVYILKIITLLKVPENRDFFFEFNINLGKMNNVLIQPANRIQHVQEYYFSRKLRELDEMKRNGISIINLGIGSPDLSPAAEVIQVLHLNAMSPSNHGYQSYSGTPALRTAFASWYRKYFGVTLNPDNEILPLIGSKEGIMHISMAFINEGDEVLIPNPGYPAYEAATKLAGGRPRFYDLKERQNWQPDLDTLRKHDLSKVKIMWVNYPHMPTGTKGTRELFHRLVEFSHAHNILICNDNPYSFILNEKHISILSAKGAMGSALELNSLSKSHNMAGWRIGMVAGNSAYISAVLKVKSNMDSGMFQPLQAAAAQALSAPESWYDDNNRVYRKRRSVAEEILRILRCSFDPDQSGLFLWARVPSRYDTAEDLTEKVLQKSHVFITPGHIFGSNGVNFIRISLCSGEKVLAEACDRIKRDFSHELIN
jgi:LL-diaminopimelate aminotransferase